MAGEALNRCWFTTTSTGTGDLVVAGAVTDANYGDYFTPAQAGFPAATRKVSYVLTRGNDTEIGVADYNGSTNTLVRSAATVTLSKIAGTAGTSKLTLAAGESRVMLTWIAEDLRTPTISETKPATPSTGIALWVRNMAGRKMLGSVRSGDGDTGLYSPHWGRNRIGMAVPIGSSTSVVNVWGIIAPTLTGGTSRAVATTNFFLNQKRIGHVTAATAAASAAAVWTVAQFARGNVAGVGGFHFLARFGNSHAAAVAQGRAFVGLTAAVAAIGNVNPSTLLNIIGMGYDSAQANWRVFHNDGSGTATAIDLGANFPTGLGAAGSQNWYEAQFFCAPNTATIGYRIERLDPANNFVAEGTISTDMPVATTLLAPQIWVNNGTTAAAHGLDWSMLYVEMDN